MDFYYNVGILFQLAKSLTSGILHSTTIYFELKKTQNKVYVVLNQQKKVTSYLKTLFIILLTHNARINKTI